MDLREQVLRFRHLLEQGGFSIDDFELNVDGDVFKSILAGGGGHLEVHCRTSGVTLVYDYDGSDAWLDAFAGDLGNGTFSK